MSILQNKCIYGRGFVIGSARKKLMIESTTLFKFRMDTATLLNRESQLVL